MVLDLANLYWMRPVVRRWGIFRGKTGQFFSDVRVLNTYLGVAICVEIRKPRNNGDIIPRCRQAVGQETDVCGRAPYSFRRV